MLLSFIVLGFVAHIDEAFSKIFVCPGIMRQCEIDLDECFERGKVKIHWFWNRAVAILLATMVTLSVLWAERLMRSALVLDLRTVFYFYPWDKADQVRTRGSDSAEVCNKLYQFLVMVALFGAWILALLSQMKRFLMGPFGAWILALLSHMKRFLMEPRLQYDTRRVVQKSGGTASRQLGVEENLNALCLAFCALIGYACTFFIILAVWLVFAVWIGGLLTLSERVPNPY